MWTQQQHHVNARPRCRLTPPFQRIPTNICTNLTLPETKFSISEISNDNISGMGCPIDFVFDPRVGFFGMADRMYLLPLGPIQEAAARHLGKFRMDMSLEWIIRSIFMN